MNAMPNCRQKESAYFILNDALITAYKSGIMSINIMAMVQKYVHDRSEGRAMTRAEQALFEAATAKVRTGPALLFTLYTGCRRGESVSTCWEDIDFDTKTIHIRGTKTKGSDRIIPLFPPLSQQLRPHVNRRGKLFDITGEYLGKSIAKMGLPFHVAVKDLRTTFSTRCKELGVPDEVLAKWLGHTSTRTTQ